MSTAATSVSPTTTAVNPLGPKRRWPKILLWVVLIGIAVLGVMYWMASAWPVLPLEKIAQPTVIYSKIPPEIKFSISLEAPIDHPHDKELDVTLVLANSSDAKIQLQALDRGLPFQTGDCPSLKISNRQQASTLAVDPHSSVTYVLHLVADCPSEAQPISLHYKAQIGDNKANEVDGYIQTTPLTVVAEGRHTLAKFFTLFNGLLHLFLAPIALAFFGWWLSILISKRDAKLKEDQESRDRILKEGQEARDRRYEVLNTLISGYRDLVTGDYLPISRRMQTVEAQLPAALKSPPVGALTPPLTEATIKGLLCAILLYRSRLLRFVTQKGGIYFRSSQAEFLFRDLMDDFLGKARLMLDGKDFNEAVSLLHPEDTLVTAMKKFETGVFIPELTTQQLQQAVGVLSPADAAAIAQLSDEYLKKNQAQYDENKALYKRLETALLKWVNDAPAEFRSYTRLLQIATELLAFECDRPFYQTAPLGKGEKDDPELRKSGWYFDPPVIELTAEMYQVPDDLKKDDPATGKRGLHSQLTAYLENIPPECWENVPLPKP